MRDYIEHIAEQTSPYGRLTTLWRIWKNLKQNRALLKLASLPDYLLADIGLSRGDLYLILSLPLTADRQAEFERMQRHNQVYGNLSVGVTEARSMRLPVHLPVPQHTKRKAKAQSFQPVAEKALELPAPLLGSISRWEGAHFYATLQSANLSAVLAKL